MKLENILLLSLIAVLPIISACHEKGTEPQPNKNPREYTWIADTIYYPGSYNQTEMLTIWGSSPNDVYGVGFNNASAVTIWHYDGNSWTDVKLDVFGINPIVLSCIYGFSSNDIWAVGWRGDLGSPNSGAIIHYDGSKWSEANIIKGGALNDICGSSPNDIWACGFWGIVYHYDGTKWDKDSLSVYMPQGAEFQLLNIRESKNIAYATGVKYENSIGFTYYFFKQVNKSWQIIDSLVSGSGTFAWGTKLWESPEGNLFSFRDGVFKWNGNSWDDVFLEPYALESLDGTSEQNVFAVGNYGIAYHYNGSDWYQFQQLKNENIVYTGVWTDGNEAFICGFTTNGYPQKTIVWHGK